MDMGMIFNITFYHIHKIFKHVIMKWLSHPSFYNINGINYCSDDERMKEVALQFARGSNGVIGGCIGALDGWVVKKKSLQHATVLKTQNHSTAEKVSLRSTSKQSLTRRSVFSFAVLSLGVRSMIQKHSKILDCINGLCTIGSR